jgi:hypothetical protein
VGTAAAAAAAAAGVAAGSKTVVELILAWRMPLTEQERLEEQVKLLC